MPRTFYVYGLRAPDTDEIRYVGRALARALGVSVEWLVTGESEDAKGAA